MDLTIITNIQATNETKPTNLSTSIDAIAGLYKKYENNPYMCAKIQNHICNQLPNILENILSTHESRIQRTEQLVSGQDTFIQTFLKTNQYFYVNSIDAFFYYDMVHYQRYSEDAILHHILTSITRERNLMSWKYKTKTSIMKKIKDNSLLTSIPESETIQHVILSLYPLFFRTKDDAKYFLTVIGDNIHKKQPHLIHFMPLSAKPFITELNNISQTHIGANLFQTLKFKYHDHEFANCRLIHFNDTINYENIWKPVLQNLQVDILCVSSHYSIRYEDSDQFASMVQDSQFQTDVFYLKNSLQCILMK